jgi:acetyl-CoA carboxylase carboxyltransferase component
VEPAALDWTATVPVDPRATYDARTLVDAVVDDGSFFEIKERYAPEIVVGVARLEGVPVGIVANQPSVKAGAIFVDSADKAARHITFCDAFGLPLLFFCDTPGFMVGTVVEREGIIRHGAKMIAAMSSAEVPRYCIVVRKASGAGYYAMASPGFEPDATIALSTAQITPMGADAAVNAVFANRIMAIADDEERAAFVTARREEYDAELGVIRMASDLLVDAVVKGDELRSELARRLASTGEHRRVGGHRHHINAPV